MISNHHTIKIQWHALDELAHSVMECQWLELLLLEITPTGCSEIFTRHIRCRETHAPRGLSTTFDQMLHREIA